MTALPENAPSSPNPGSPRGSRLLLGALVLLGVVNFIWMIRSCETLRPAPARGGPAPDFTVPRLGGGSFQLSRLRGRPVLVDFWATWCGPCQQSLPILDHLYQRYRGRGLEAIAIETDGAEGPARRFIERLGLRLPVGLGTPELSVLYGVSTIPYLVIIDRQGRVRHVLHGVHSAAELSRAVEEAM